MPRDIRAFFECYCEAFNALDGEAVAELYAEPSGIAQDAVYTHWASRDSVATNMNALCKLYQDRGFQRAQFEPGQFIEQGTHHAVADKQGILGDDDRYPVTHLARLPHPSGSESGVVPLERGLTASQRSVHELSPLITT